MTFLILISYKIKEAYNMFLDSLADKTVAVLEK
jgi:hypothetical protein